MGKTSLTPSALNEFSSGETWNDIEMQKKLEEYRFKITDTFQAKMNYIHRKVAGSDMLISVGENIANFNGYIEMNASAAYIWDSMKEPCTVRKLGLLLTEAFEISQVQAMEDVLEFVKELREHDMVLIGEA